MKFNIFYVSYRSFAYITLKDRLPVILTKIIDTLSRNKEDIVEKYGEVKYIFRDIFTRILKFTYSMCNS